MKCSKYKIKDKFFKTVSLVLGAYSNVSGLIVIGNCQLQNKEIVRGLGYIYETYPSSTVVRYPNQRNSPLAITRMFNRKKKKKIPSKIEAMKSIVFSNFVVIEICLSNQKVIYVYP